MFRINYRINGKITTKTFDSIIKGYQFAIQNIATQEDRDYYKMCCGDVFESITDESIMVAVMRNSMENICLVEKGV